MSSNPLRRSVASPAGAFRARSKLSTTGRMFLITSPAANSLNSCCSRTCLLRALSNSACRRARRSKSASRSTRSFSISDTGAVVAADGVDEGFSSPDSAGGSSCSRSRFASVFPFPLPILPLLRFIQKFVEQAGDVRHRRHGVLIVETRRANHRQRSHDFPADAGGSANQDKVAHRRQGLVEPNHHTHCFPAGVQISAEQ